MVATEKDIEEGNDKGSAGTGSVGQAARGTALNLIGALTTAVLSFVTVSLVTNSYGRDGAGLFFTATAAFTLAAQSARLGSETGLTYFVSRLRATERQGQARSLIAAALGTTAAAAGVLALFGLVGASTVAGWIGADDLGSRSEMVRMIRVLAPAVPAYALSQCIFGATRGFGTMRPSVVYGQILRPVAQLVFVLLAIVTSAQIWPLGLAWSAAAVVTLVPSAFWLWRRLTRIVMPPEPFGLARYWRFAGPRAAADLVSSLLERLDVILVAMLVGQAAAGLYGASNRLILAGQMLMMATSQSMAPHLSAAFARDDNDEARNVLQTVSAWNVVLLWPIFICLAFGAETTLRLFGAEFAEAAPVVVVLSLGLLVVVALGMGDTLLLMTGDSLVSLINHLVALGVMVGVSVLTLPTIGLVGAGWAWVGSRIALRALSAIRVWQTKRVQAIGPAGLTAMAVAVAAYVPLGSILYRTQGQGWTTLAAHVIAGSLLYLGLVVGLRERLKVDELLAVVARRKS